MFNQFYFIIYITNDWNTPPGCKWNNIYLLNFFKKESIHIEYLSKSVDPRNYKVDFKKINKNFKINFTPFNVSLNKTYNSILKHTKKNNKKNRFGNFKIKNQSKWIFYPYKRVILQQQVYQ